MFYKNEKNLIFIIRYAPLLLIIILSTLTIYFMEQANKKQFAQEMKRTTELYVKLNNEELKKEITKLHLYIQQQDQKSKEKLKEKIKMRVYEAHAIATKIYEDNKNIKSKKEIFKLIKTALGSIIYNKGRGYFFIDDVNGVKLLQPLNKKIENKNFSQLKDVNGYRFIQKIMQTIKDKTERFDTYYWYKNSSDKTAYKKVSFYKYFEPYNVAIGTGEYLDDYEKELKIDVIQSIQNINLNNDGYIFMFNFDGIMLSHKNKRLIGGDYLHDKGPISTKQVANFIKIGKTKEAFMSYFNPSMQDQPYKKTSFIKGYKKWKWVFGTGYNNADLVKIIEKAQVKLEEKNKENFLQILYISLIITVALLVLSIIISKYLEKIFTKYKQRIQDEEKGFRNLFEYSNIGLAICDDNGKFININSKFIQMLGYQNKTDLLNKKWHSIFIKNSVETESKNFSDLISQKINKYSTEKSFTKENGTIIDTLITANLLKEKKEVKNILFSIIDVTELKTKDKLLFQQAKLASMGEMIANIAHQWRQPLSLISTASSGLKMQKEFNILTDETFYSSVNSITNATQYLSQTIENFKNFFTPRLKKEYFRLDDTIQKTLVLVSAELKRKDIEIIDNINNIEILSYENDLIQVIINIINNAKDAFTKESGNFIFIDTELTNKTKNINIKIKDNAGGIPDEFLGKIYEPYFTTKYKSNGTGIGLYMVMEIIQKHMQGTISVQNVSYSYKNKEYEGAEFIINIPIK